LSIFSNKTTTPHPTLSPRGEGFTKIRTAKERITKDKTQKAISTKPKFQQVNQGNG
jgi:hypothetical protein